MVVRGRTRRKTRAGEVDGESARAMRASKVADAMAARGAAVEGQPRPGGDEEAPLVVWSSEDVAPLVVSAAADGENVSAGDAVADTAGGH